ncbi:MAG: DUF3467 domain-containing protein [Phycisphaerae bacterium]|jgi:hypothetical protein
MAEELPKFYVNVVELTASPYDFTFDFGLKTPEQLKQGGSDFERTVRIAMSPSHAKSMLPILTDSIRTYEENFGIIPSPHYDKDEEG